MRKLKERYPIQTLLTLGGITIWVLILNVAAIYMKLTSWPIFFASIFFFEMGATLKNAPKIFGGGVFGLLCTWLLFFVDGILAPILGPMPGILIPLLIIISAIIMCGPICPILCNNVAFAYLTIFCLSPAQFSSFTETLKVIAVFLIGGLMMVLGAHCVVVAVAKKYPAPDPEPIATEVQLN